MSPPSPPPLSKIPEPGRLLRDARALCRELREYSRHDDFSQYERDVRVSAPGVRAAPPANEPAGCSERAQAICAALAAQADALAGVGADVSDAATVFAATHGLVRGLAPASSGEFADELAALLPILARAGDFGWSCQCKCVRTYQHLAGARAQWAEIWDKCHRVELARIRPAPASSRAPKRRKRAAPIAAAAAPAEGDALMRRGWALEFEGPPKPVLSRQLRGCGCRLCRTRARASPERTRR